MMNWNIQLYRYFNLWTVVACIHTNIIWVHLLFAWVSMQIHSVSANYHDVNLMECSFLNQELIIDEARRLSTMSETIKTWKCYYVNPTINLLKTVVMFSTWHLTVTIYKKFYLQLKTFFASFCFVLTVAFKSKLLLIFEFDMKYGK